MALVEGRVQCFPLVGGGGLVETSVFSPAILSLRKSLRPPFILLIIVREWPPFLPNRVLRHAKIHQQWLRCWVREPTHGFCHDVVFSFDVLDGQIKPSQFLVPPGSTARHARCGLQNLCRSVFQCLVVGQTDNGLHTYAPGPLFQSRNDGVAFFVTDTRS